MAEQFDMLVIDRGHTGGECADQTYRIVAPADAGLEHREIALAFLKIKAGQRKQSLEGAEFFTPALRDFGNSGFDPRHQARQIIIANGRAIDLKPFVEAIQMRRGEHSGSQAVGAGDAGAEGRGRAFAVRTCHSDRIAREPCPIHRKGIEQVGHPRQTNVIPVFRKIKHSAVPWWKMCDARSSGSDRYDQIPPAAGSTGWSSPRSPV